MCVGIRILVISIEFEIFLLPFISIISIVI